MAGNSNGDRQRDAADPTIVAAIETEIERIQTLKLDEARGLWRQTFKKDVPRALTRDLMVRTLCWHIQEQAFGGHDRATLRLLDGYARGKPGGTRRQRRLKPGTELVREFQGERHTVVITAEGFRWQDGDYPSLTAIARVITGTNWNGPRFFGLRVDGEADGGAANSPNKTRFPAPVRGGKASREQPA